MIAVKVVYNALEDSYEVYARRWWGRWSFQKSYKYCSEVPGTEYYTRRTGTRYCFDRTTAEANAIAYAKSLLNKQVVFKSSNFFY